jgi:hypothetical protein
MTRGLELGEHDRGQQHEHDGAESQQHVGTEAEIEAAHENGLDREMKATWV